VWLGMATLMFGRAATLGWRYFKDDESPLYVTPLECAVYYDDLPSVDVDFVDVDAKVSKDETTKPR